MMGSSLLRCAKKEYIEVDYEMANLLWLLSHHSCQVCMSLKRMILVAPNINHEDILFMYQHKHQAHMTGSGLYVFLYN